MPQEIKDEILTSEDTLIVFDTNIWLSLYELAHPSRDTFIELIKKPKILNKIWIPFQVAKEFFDQYIYMIREQQNVISDFNEIIDSSLDPLITNIGNKKLDKHPFIDKKKLVASAKRYKKLLKSQVKQGSENYPASVEDDFLITIIQDILTGKIGHDFDEETKKKLKTKGKKRYEDKIPPGYEDNSKHAGKKYGDFFLWKQLCNQATEQSAHAIFVTNDFKADWWHLYNKERLAPRYELRKEFKELTNYEILILSQEEFSDIANNLVEEKIDSEKIDNLKSNIRTTLDLSKKKTTLFPGTINLKIPNIEHIKPTRTFLESLKRYEELEKEFNTRTTEYLKNIQPHIELINDQDEFITQLFKNKLNDSENTEE